jgi:hypothetical protein
VRGALIISLTITTPAIAQSSATSTEAMARYRALTSVVSPRCARNAAADEIIVCGEDLNRTQRLPYPEERNEPGERKGLIAGEVPSAMNAFRTPCPPRGCPGGGSLIGGLSKIVERLRD